MHLAVKLKAHIEMLVGTTDHVEVPVVVGGDQDWEQLSQHVGLGSSRKFNQSRVVDVELQS